MNKKRLKKRLDELKDEYNGIMGMVDEMSIKLRMLRSKTLKSKKSGEAPPDELVEEVRKTDIKFHLELAKYKKRVDEIRIELKEISDAFT